MKPAAPAPDADREETTERNPLSIAAWKRRAERAEREAAALRAELNIAQRFAPEIRTCRSCGRKYPVGYVCGCGHDNSIKLREGT